MSEEVVIEGARKELVVAAEDLKTTRSRLLGVQGSIPPSRQETSLKDLDGDPDVETEIRSVIANSIRDCLDPLIDDLLAAAQYQPQNGNVSHGARSKPDQRRLARRGRLST